MKPLKLPRGWMPWPPQLPQVRRGTSDLGEVGGAGFVPVVVEGVGLDVGVGTGTIGGEFFLGEGDGPGGGFTGVGVLAGGITAAVLHHGDLDFWQKVFWNSLRMPPW